MEDFSIDVMLHGKEYSFIARMATVGYSHKFYVLINELEVVYEPDEERNFRALLADTDTSKINEFDIQLIAAVGNIIQSTSDSKDLSA